MSPRLKWSSVFFFLRTERGETLPENKLLPLFYVAPTLLEKTATLKAVKVISEASEKLIKDWIMTADTDWHIWSLFPASLPGPRYLTASCTNVAARQTSHFISRPLFYTAPQITSRGTSARSDVVLLIHKQRQGKFLSPLIERRHFKTPAVLAASC